MRQLVIQKNQKPDPLERGCPGTKTTAELPDTKQQHLAYLAFRVLSGDLLSALILLFVIAVLASDEKVISLCPCFTLFPCMSLTYGCLLSVYRIEF